MKKKITICVLLSVVCITAIALLCAFTTPVFYNTDYNVYCYGVNSSQRINQTFEFHKDGTLKYTYQEGQHNYEETHTFVVVGDKLFIDEINTNNMLTIKNKFSLKQGNYDLNPSGGGVVIYILLLLLNIPATIALCIMFGVWITKKTKSKKSVDM